MPDSAQTPASGPSERAEQGTVLVVEDNETDVFVIKEVLALSGLDFRLRVVKDGEEALAWLDDIANDENVPCPELVLLDLNIPKIAGIEVLRRLRGFSRCNRIPVVVVTSSDSQSDREAVQNLGAARYFRKPADLAAYLELAGVIRAVLPRFDRSKT